MGSARVGSNPIFVVIFFINICDTPIAEENVEITVEQNLLTLLMLCYTCDLVTSRRRLARWSRGMILA
jgi:hypothetical protein